MKTKVILVPAHIKVIEIVMATGVPKEKTEQY